MKIIISESQYKRLISEDKFALAALSNNPDLLNKIIDNFGELEKVNCHEIDRNDYNIPLYVRTYCRYLRDMNIHNVKNLRKKYNDDDNNNVDYLAYYNDKLINYFNQFYNTP